VRFRLFLVVVSILGAVAFLQWGLGEPVASVEALHEEKLEAAAGLSASLLESLASSADFDLASGALDQKIELTRTSCFGVCPVYSVTLHSDGRAEYAGWKHTPPIGSFRGRLDIDAFTRLSRLIQRLDIRSMERVCTAPWTCDSTAILRVQAADTAADIEIRDCGKWGPIELQALLMVVDSLSAKIAWEPVQAP